MVWNMDTTKKATRKSVKEEELFMCAPSVYGFSFASKKWGQIYVNELDDLTFDDAAFDQLVMDSVKKELIYNLVTSNHEGLDIISGKDGGLASIWNAVILIDEADIFLERRSEHDIQHNAMVSIFLRLLEYPSRYFILDKNRGKEWNKLSNAQTKRPINGREIKTVIRIAKALAIKKDPNALITTQQLKTVLNLSKSYKEEMSENTLN
ncbi:hypothetical protein C1645_833013 [Glomus cerebriforme]|uniref:ATPase AAA-type core domain-containing protein n=1 Tax=Glomus cerebriforme TaxID=658196 RepID=A0A397SGD8_9GLOM|nr:hypothetical protein C1645_833013 [Glomus cerebriforme]